MNDCHIRAGALTGYLQLVAELGGEAEALLRPCGLNPESIADPDRLVSYRAVMEAIEAGARELDCTDFGLRLKQKQDLSFLGPLALVIQSAGTVRDGFVMAGRHMGFHTPGVLLKVLPHRGATTLERVEFHLRISKLPQLPQVAEHAVAHMASTLAILDETGGAPHGIHLTHSAQSARSVYRAHLGVTPVFESDFNGLLIDAVQMRRKVNSQNPVLQAFVERYILGVKPPENLSTAEQVQLVLEQLLPGGQGDLASAARVMYLHPRTLQRRLQKEGVQFEALRVEGLKKLALKLLAQKQIPLERVAHLLGFAEQPVLTRACRRWFGQTPAALRQSSRSVADS